MIFIFWFSLFVIVYTFLGYGVVLYILLRIRRMVKGRRMPPIVGNNLPTLTFVVAAYNEEGIILEKIQNTLGLNYPADKLNVIFITDGSSDRTPDIIRDFPQIQLLHSPERRGKILAIHRAMKFANSEIAVFTDANAFLNKDALALIARHYSDSAVGAVSGEKRVLAGEQADATGGEGVYWKYESTLKKWDSELYSVVGAAGELFSVRTSLYKDVEADTILDDFMISMLIAKQGYRIVYEPDAYATELSSDNIGEELKRKVRIAAGGIQSILRLLPLLNPFAYPVLSFQYISHRVLRWTVTPFFMILLFLVNILIVLKTDSVFYQVVLGGQVLFYLLAIWGWGFEKRNIKIKGFFVPFYFCFMNYAVFAGILRYFRGRQSAVWEKSVRKSN